MKHRFYHIFITCFLIFGCSHNKDYPPVIPPEYNHYPDMYFRIDTTLTKKWIHHPPCLDVAMTANSAL